VHAALASLREVLRVVTRFSVPAQAENSAPKKMSSRSVTSFSFVSLSWLNGMCKRRSTTWSGGPAGSARRDARKWGLAEGDAHDAVGIIRGQLGTAP